MKALPENDVIDPISESHSPYLYDAFACYSTDPDGEMVREIEAFLESLHRNSLIDRRLRRKMELCVDGSDFKLPSKQKSAAPGADDPVFDLIVEYLKRARRCVVFVGPSSHKHEWMTREIDWWLDNRSADDLIIALTHGRDPVGDREGTFPRRLLDAKLDRKPWIDLRGWPQRKSSGVAVRPYLEQRLRLAADLMDPPVAPSELITSWRVGARRQRRWNLLIGTAVAIFAAALLTRLGFALQERNENARHARSSALALAARLSSEASDNRSLEALAYAASSVALEPTPQGYEALIRTMRLLPPHVWESVHDATSHAVDAVLFLEGDSIVASSGWTGTLRFARASEGTELARIALSGRATMLLRHPTQRLLAIATQHGIDLVKWTTDATGVQLQRIGHSDPGRVRGLAFTADGSQLIVGSFEGTLNEFDLNAAALQGWQPHRTHTLLDADGDKVGINGIAIDPASRQLVLADILGTIYCLPADWNAPPRKAKHSTEIFALAQDPAGGKLAMADADGGWLIFNPAKCSIDSYNAPAREPATAAWDANGHLRSVPRFERARTGIAYSMDGSLIAIASHDSTVRIVVAADGSVLRLMVLPAMTRAVAFADNGRHVVTGSDDGKVNLWDIIDGPERWSLVGVKAVATEPITQWIAAWSDDRSLQLLNAADGTVLDHARLPDNPSEVYPLGLGKSGRWILQVSGSTHAPTFSVDTDSKAAHLVAGISIDNPNSPGDVAPILEIHPVGTGTIATRDREQQGAIRLRDVSTGRQLFVRSLPDTSVLAAAGNLVAAGSSNGDVQVFDQLGTLHDAVRSPGPVTTLALSPSGEQLVVGFSEKEGGGACLCTRQVATHAALQTVLVSWLRRRPFPTRAQCQVTTGNFHCTTLAIQGRLTHAVFAPNASSIGLAVQGRNIDDGTLLLTRADDDYAPHVLSVAGRVRDLAFSSDGRWLAAGGMDRAATIYDVARATSVATLPLANPLQQVGWIGQRTDDLMTLDGVGTGFLRVWEWQPGKLLAAACSRWPSWLAPPQEPELPKPSSRAELCK
jgi:WD40 repeat protein